MNLSLNARLKAKHYFLKEVERLIVLFLSLTLARTMRKAIFTLLGLNIVRLKLLNKPVDCRFVAEIQY